MAETSNLKVVISADTASLKKGMDEVQTTLAKTAVAAQKTDSALGNIRSGTNQATQALGGLGSSLRNIPGGFAAAANSVTPLVDSLGGVASETAATGSAFSSLIGTLIGSVGVGAAITVVIGLFSALVASMSSGASETENLGNRLKTISADFEDVKTSVDATGKALDSLKQLRDINLKIRFGAGSIEGTKLAFGYDIASEENKYYGLIKLINAAEEERSAIYDQIQKRGSAGLNELFGKNLSIAEIRRQAIDLSEKDNKLLDAYISAYRKKIDLQNQQEPQLQNINKLRGEEKIAIDEINKKEAERIKNIRSISDVVADLAKQMEFLNKRETLFKTDENQNRIKAMTSAIDELLSKFKLMPKDPVIIKIKLELDKLNRGIATENLLNSISPEGATASKPLGLNLFVKPNITFVGTMSKEAKDRFQRDVEAQMAFYQSILTGAFDALQAGIDAAVSGKNFFGSFFASLLDSLGSGLKQLGLYAVTASAAIQAIKKNLGNVTGIGLGLGLIAIGTLISAASKKLSAAKFASGVRSFGGGMAMVGERGPEMVYLPSGSSVEPNNQLNAFGNGNSIIIPEMRLAYDALYIAFKRGEKIVSRNG